MSEPTFHLPEGLSKRERYEAFLKDYTVFIEGETDEITELANTAAALREAFGFFWVGFYLVKEPGWLHLGPFQGSVACSRIKYGRGVCGSAWAQAQTLVVPDVEAFPGHIACDSASNSEIVVPIHSDGKVVAVLDIDSPSLSRFDENDKEGLEQFVKALEETVDFTELTK